MLVWDYQRKKQFKLSETKISRYVISINGDWRLQRNHWTLVPIVCFFSSSAFLISLACVFMFHGQAHWQSDKGKQCVCIWYHSPTNCIRAHRAKKVHSVVLLYFKVFWVSTAIIFVRVLRCCLRCTTLTPLRWNGPYETLNQHNSPISLLIHCWKMYQTGIYSFLFKKPL